jgi:DNA polymerase
MLHERDVWLLDQKINMRGLQVDLQFVAKAALIVGELNQRLNAEVKRITGEWATATSQVKKLQIWMACEGFPVESLRKDVVTEMLTKRDLDHSVRELLELRQEGAKSSVSKLNALLNSTCADGRARDNLMYHAASTGRWGGKGFQPQNLPRLVKQIVPYLKNAIDIISDGCTTDEFIAAVKKWELDHNEKAAAKAKAKGVDPDPYFVFRPLDVISCCLRPCIIAAPGKKLILADYSSVEARGVAWVALAQELLKVFRSGGDPYLYMACLIYNKPQGTFTKEGNPKERQLGKTAVLGLGYQMGAAKFLASCEKERIFILESEAEKVVAAYREGNPEIPEFWKEIENAAFEAVNSRSQLVTSVGGRRVKFARQGTWLYMQLPSGRLLSYADPRILQREMPWLDGRTGGKAKKWCVSYMGVDSLTHQWKRQYGYGGKWTENLVQALCRDLLAEGMLRLEAHGYPLVLTVHDEAVGEVEEGFGTVEEFENLMAKPPDWASDFPLTAEAEWGYRYKLGAH